MRHCFFISIAALTALASQASAGTVGPAMPAKDWAWLAAISAGPAWARGGETQRFYLAPEIEKAYVARKSTNALVFGELFIGLQKQFFLPSWQGQLGIALATTSNARLNGQIWDDAEPQFDNYDYQYKVKNSSRVAVKAKLLFDQGYWLTPWVSGSVGVGFNRAHDFANTPLIFEAWPNSNFSNQTKTVLSYTLGAGVQKPVDEHWQVGVGYEFSDWGKSALGRAADQTMGTGLKLNHLTTNGILLNLTYVA